MLATQAVEERTYMQPTAAEVAIAKATGEILLRGRKATSADMHVKLKPWRTVTVVDKDGNEKQELRLNSLNPKNEEEVEIVRAFQNRIPSREAVIQHMQYLKQNYLLGLGEKVGVLLHRSVVKAFREGKAEPWLFVEPGKDVLPLDIQASIDSGEYTLIIIGGGTTNLAQYEILKGLTENE